MKDQGYGKYIKEGIEIVKDWAGTHLCDTQTIDICADCKTEIDLIGCSYGCPMDYDANEYVKRKGHVLKRTYRITRELLKEECE